MDFYTNLYKIFIQSHAVNSACYGKRQSVFLTFLEKPLGFSRETEMFSVEILRLDITENAEERFPNILGIRSLRIP
jgi:hypothetical protein